MQLKGQSSLQHSEMRFVGSEQSDGSMSEKSFRTIIVGRRQEDLT